MENTQKFLFEGQTGWEHSHCNMADREKTMCLPRANDFKIKYPWTIAN